MRRPFVNPTLGLALALVPAVLFAQATPPAQQPPTQQPTAQQPPADTGKPAAPKLTFKSTAGMLLVQVKPAETAAFEEMIAKLKSGTASATDPQIKQQGQVKAYKSAEPGPGGNVFYVMLYDPATPGAEYNWLDVINKTLTPEQQREPATREMYAKWAASVATMNILNLTEVK
ncbi:MAG: hypothetical protein ACJ731_14315 [Vicinamibacterales bacterium]